MNCEKSRVNAKDVLKKIGGFPRGDTLNLQVISEEECDLYTRKLVRYNVFKDEKVEAYVLIPKGISTPMPSVLAIHGEGNNNSYESGKSNLAVERDDNYLAVAAELCKKGNVVICPDRFPYESRRISSDELQNEYERIEAGNKLLYEGITELGKEINELIIAVDVLLTFDQVNSEKIGVIGISEGAFLAIIAMIVDPRIKAGCSINLAYMLKNNLKEASRRKRNAYDMFLAIPEIACRYNISSLLKEIAPKPFIWLENEKNMIKPEVDEICQEAKANYLDMRIPNEFISIIYASSMFLPNDIKAKSYQWLDKWLRHI